jgi:hypothetical protein
MYWKKLTQSDYSTGVAKGPIYVNLAEVVDIERRVRPEHDYTGVKVTHGYTRLTLSISRFVAGEGLVGFHDVTETPEEILGGVGVEVH